MHGNVLGVGLRLDGQIIPIGSQTNPEGPASGFESGFSGWLNWNGYAKDLRSAERQASQY